MRPDAIRPRKSVFSLPIAGRPNSQIAGSADVIPSDLLDGARQRLAILALFFSVLGAVATPVHLFLLAKGISSVVASAFDISAGIISLLVYFAVRNKRWSASRIFTFGLFYEFIICFMTAMGVQIYMQDQYGHMSVFSPTNIIILIFAVIIPMRPRKALFASLAAATT
ncbi:MAG: hypothetical protein MJE77_34180, partial [Proteobacteria bacterium]|nr:hypothetical protein [Pseudomonadota bacterium]